MSIASAVATISAEKRSSNGFSNRCSVNFEKPRPSTRTIACAPGGTVRPWNYSRSRCRASNSLPRMGGTVLGGPAGGPPDFHPITTGGMGGLGGAFRRGLI